MKVVNVKVANLRPMYNDLKDWMNDANNEYIGRARIVFINGTRFPQSASIWANPFKVGKDGTREDIIIKYETYIKQKLENSSELTSALKELKNKNLGCWCKPEACHGDVLSKLINNEDTCVYLETPLLISETL